MCISNEMINVINLYQVLKKDLYTLLVKGSENPLDYEGKINTGGNKGRYLKYPINEENQGSEMYHALVSLGILLESMLKHDVQLWDKTQGIMSIRVAPDYRCETIVLDIISQD